MSEVSVNVRCSNGEKFTAQVSTAARLVVEVCLTNGPEDVGDGALSSIQCNKRYTVLLRTATLSVNRQQLPGSMEV